jgi:hypothetical protein
MPRRTQPAWKRRLAASRFCRRAVAEAAAPGFQTPKLTPRFRIGLAVLAFSYLLAWPLIGFLGILAVRGSRPALVTIGGPIAYGVSTVVFFLGIFLSGKDGLRFLRAFGYRLMARFHARHLAVPDEEDGHNPGE